MSSQVNLPVVGRVDTKSLAVGAVLLLALLVVPKVSDFTIPVVTKLRDMIGGRK